MTRITLLAEPDCVFSGLSAAVEFFKLCNLYLSYPNIETPQTHFRAEIVTSKGREVPSFGGIPIPASGSIQDVRQTDLILIPSFQPTLELLYEISRDVLEWIRYHYERGARIGAVSAGAFLLAETGLLNGRIATTNWLFLRQFKTRYPEIKLKPQRIITEDKGLICTSSNNYTADLCAYFLRNVGYQELAAQFSKGMMLHPNWDQESPWTIFEVQKKHHDHKILEAQQWMEDNYSRIRSIDAVADRCSISPRHFKRRFKEATGDSPLNYLQRLRLEVAKYRLETTRDAFHDITWLVGYEDMNSFRRLFRKHTGLSPKEYRMRFSNIIDSPPFGSGDSW